jgi:hypothetical protein
MIVSLLKLVDSRDGIFSVAWACALNLDHSGNRVDEFRKLTGLQFPVTSHQVEQLSPISAVEIPALTGQGF